MLHIFVDADACPVKPEVYRVAHRYKLKVTLVAGAWMRIPDSEAITLRIVDQGEDAADDWIVEHLGANDLVITADIPLAARCVARGAYVLGHTGKPFSDKNIGTALATRNLLSELRKLGEVTGGPPPFKKQDRSRFLQALDKAVNEVRGKIMAQGGSEEEGGIPFIPSKLKASPCGFRIPMILINPPVVKPSEAPAGIAKLAGALQQYPIPCSVLDANLEGLLNLLKRAPAQRDTWTKVASHRLPGNLRLLTSTKGYENFDRYKRAVMGVNRVLENAAQSKGIRLSLANYADPKLSPLKSADLIRAWENPEENLFYPYFSERLAGLLEMNATNIVGLSLNYLSQALCTFAMAGFLKKQSSNLKVILGGGLVTSWMSRPDWKNPFEGLVDVMVSGPGEDALLSFVGAGGKSDHVAPDYQGFDRENYFAPGFILPYSASSGCYWGKCSFCPENAEGNSFRPVPVRQVLQDLRVLCEKRQPVLVHFLDNAMSPSLLKTLAEEAPGAPWYGFARITKDLKDPDFCGALKRSGCRMLKLGLESGDQLVLDNLCKGVDLETASLVLRALKKAGISTYVYLLFGTPAEDLEAAERTLQFTVKHSDAIDFLNIAIFNMPAHGTDADRFETRDFYEGDLYLYRGYVHPLGWDRSAVRQFLDKRFKRHPAVAAILREDPPFFTSNHAPLFSRPRDRPQ